MKKFSRLTLASAIALHSVGTLAANGDAVLEEIVVTAQKREQNLQDVPISVQVVSGKFLDDRNINQMSELTKVSPGFSFAESSSDSGKGMMIRGVGSHSFSRGMDQSVGVVVDNVIASSTSSALKDMSDVERIEVLRGPQGMLFGKNSSAGLLNIVTKGPSEELTYGMGASYGDLGLKKINAYVSGPIVEDSVLGRLSYYSNEQDGIIENLYPGGEDHNNRDEWGVKGKLNIEVSDTLSLKLIAEYTERDHICCTMAPISQEPPFTTIFPVPTGKENSSTYDNDTSEGSTESQAYSLEANYDIGEYTLTSITAYSESDEFSSFVSDQIPVTFTLDNSSYSDYEQFTQEFRITSPQGETLEYVAGLYYFSKKMHRELNQDLDLTILGGPFVSESYSESSVDTESIALFGQATYKLNENNRLSLGLRLNHEELDFTQTNDNNNPSAATGTRSDNDSDDALSWRLIYEYDLNQDSMLYASVAKGYKGPAANTLSGLSAEKMIIDPEIPTNMEVGLKSELWDGRLRLNAAIFHTTFDDFQASLGDGNLPPTFYLENAGKLETKGVEIDFALAATENLTFNGGLAFIDATFKEYEGAACYSGQTTAQGCVNDVQDLSGADMPNAPDVTVSLSGRYNVPMPSMPFDGYLQASYYWQDEVQYKANNNPLTVGDAYSVTDLTLGIESKDGRYSLQLYVKNLFDDFYVNRLDTTYDQIGIPLASGLDYAFERRIGVSARVDF
jgi:iron complex outermembrane recepter protein